MNLKELSLEELYALKEKVEKDCRTADVMQHAFKVLANSLYGAIANIHFPLFDLDNASAITLSGQSSIKYMSYGMSNYIYKITGVKKDYVIAIDTDSAYLDMSTVADKVGIKEPTPKNVDMMTKFADSKMKDESKRLADKFHAMTNVAWGGLDFKREKVICGAVYVAKKRYFIRAYDSEGVRYDEPQLGVTGLETNRSSTPKIIREELERFYDVILDTDEAGVQKEFQKFREEFYKLDPNVISFPRGVNNLEAYKGKGSVIYEKRTPIHVRASLLYNHLVNAKGLQNKYPEIKSGDKMRFVSLKMPNPLREDVIGYIDELPPEFGLHRFINYDGQFEKSFAQPLQNVLDAIGWEAEKTSSLEDFF